MVVTFDESHQHDQILQVSAANKSSFLASGHLDMNIVITLNDRQIQFSLDNMLLSADHDAIHHLIGLIFIHGIWAIDACRRHVSVHDKGHELYTKLRYEK